MDTGFAEGGRVYPARIIQVDLDEAGFVRGLEIAVFAYSVEAISQNISDPLFCWIIG
jgi:hypothetical protein